MRGVRGVIPIGEKFGRLTILEEAEQKGSCRYVRCRCDCGRETITRWSGVKGGHTASCGCLQRESAAVTAKLAHDALRTHGMSRTRFYRIWRLMKSRCLDPRAEDYKHYGARGIRVCDAWLRFEPFLADMYAAYLEHVRAHGATNTSIDRIDSRGHYEPANCRFATYHVQNWNRCSNRVVEWNGVRKAVGAWAAEVGIEHNVIYKRLDAGWTVAEALTTPARVLRWIEYRGRTRRLSDWARAFGIDPTTLRQRFERGWSPEQAFTVPVDSRRGPRGPRKRPASPVMGPATPLHGRLPEAYGP
jgi:hypothetical protein